MISRRDLVRGGVALVSIGAASNSLLKGAVAFAAANPADVTDAGRRKVLVLVQCAGGNDGLNTVTPIGDAAYHAARRTIGLADEDLLPLESGVGLAPQLTGLAGLWSEGRLAVMRGVGYPNQNYSHFKSMAIWQAGDPAVNLDSGWLGRTLASLESDHSPFFGFNIGGSTPPEMRTDAISIPSVRNLADYGFQANGRLTPATDARTATLVKLYEQYPAASPYGALLETTMETAVASSRDLQAAAKSYTPAVEYPATSFGSGLTILAEAIVGDLGMRVGHITLGGFDTHSRQVAEHAELMTTLDQGLTAFYRDLAAHGRADDVLVLTWSEFGRRVQENANGGSDHGSSSVMFALGNGVKRGLYGDQPSITQLIDNGNLSMTTDFRQVYATVIERWLGTPAAPLLNGKNWDQLEFL